MGTPRGVRPGASGFLQQAAQFLDQGMGWAGLSGDALAYVLGQVAATGRWLVVVDAPDQSERLVEGLRFFHPKPGNIEAFPADDTRPYDGFSPDPALPRQRLRALERVLRGGDLLVVATAAALLRRVPDASSRARGSRPLAVGDRVDRDDLVRWLLDAGYLATQRADGPGQVAARGDVVDVWPATARAPTRLDFFDDELESLRRLRVGSLAAGPPRKRIALLPAREERLDAEALARAQDELGRLVAERGQSSAQRRAVLEELRAGVRFSGIEDWLPALVPTEAPLDALAGLRMVVSQPDDVGAALRDTEGSARRRYDALDEGERPLVPPEARYVTAASVLEQLAEAHPVYDLAAGPAGVDLGARTTDAFAVRGAELAPAVARLEQLASDDVAVALVVESEERARRLDDLLAPHGVHPKRVTGPQEAERGSICTIVGLLSRGFVAPESGFAFVPVSALFGVRSHASDRAHQLFDAAVTSTAQLKEGEHVVHRRHGIGIYLGLVRVPIGKVAQDFVKLEYRGGDVMMLPVTALAQLSRYTPSTTNTKVRLDRLGGVTWERKKGKVRDHLLKMAQDLLKLYARREVATRAPYAAEGARYRAFEARFPHEETRDQATAIAAVLEDLDRPYPMDRLVVGDVGFGKTEVAMRATMRAVESGRQVGVLCPTTVLAYQHLNSFRERFASDPEVNIAMLSRFVDRSEEDRVLAGLADGSVHVVVGTTALLARRVRYDNLGLVVVDEEHRFGVKQKDRLKRMRTEVDVLSMSATPIPRTLQLALSGAREMSLIATAPAARLEVRTQVARVSEARVRDAILTELDRGGQVYVIHNRVESISRFTDTLRQWVPQATFGVGHGQLDDAALEKVLVDFIEQRTDVLVCTSIVESGVDLPNVNTMLVHRADLFGLAQLYQLRGRVGRSDRRATCLLLTPEDVSREARRRLKVLVENTRLGSGFQIAAADLELRGGGNLLGEAQSGNIDQVGYETWVELLQQAVHSARGDLDRDRIEPEVEVPVDAFLPQQLLPDMQERLGWYRRLADADTTKQVDRALDELEGLVGDLPDEAKNLAGLMIARIECRQLGIVRCSWLKVRVAMVLHPSSPIDQRQLARVVEEHPRRFAVEEVGGERRLSVRFTPVEAEAPFLYLRWVFSRLRPKVP